MKNVDFSDVSKKSGQNFKLKKDISFSQDTTV